MQMVEIKDHQMHRQSSHVLDLEQHEIRTMRRNSVGPTIVVPYAVTSHYLNKTAEIIRKLSAAVPF